MSANLVGGLAGRLHRGQEQSDQDADDRDDHQQFNQGEATTRGLIRHAETPPDGQDLGAILRLVLPNQEPHRNNLTII